MKRQNSNTAAPHHSHTSPYEVWLLLDSRDFGGIESHVLQLAQGLSTVNCVVTVVFLSRYKTEHPLLTALTNANISYHFLDGKFMSLLHYTQQHPPTVIHSHGYKAAIYSRLLRLSLLLSSHNVRFINTFHAGEIGSGKLRWYDRIDRWSAALSHHNFAVSEQIKQRVHTPITVLNNFISTDQLSLSNGKEIAFVGRLSHEKAPDRFLQLAQQHPKHDFHIYGSGPMENGIAQQAPINLILHGHQSTMEPIWKDIGLLVICSRYEGLPMAALEAMGRGIPIISTPVGNMSKLITQDNNGWIVEPDGLSAQLQYWFDLDDSNKATIQASAQQTIQTDFSTQAIIPQVFTIYAHT